MVDRQRRSSVCHAKLQSGFTLVEIIVGIVVSAVALTFLSTLFFSNAGRSAEPILQIRAAEFGQALLEEILAKPFDENTPVGGVPACSTLGTGTATDCTAEASFDELEARSAFDDVDDYDRYCGGTFPLSDASGAPLSGVGQPFENYLMQICVTYDGDFDGVGNDGNVGAKLITVEISLPPGVGAPLVFSAYKGNY